VKIQDGSKVLVGNHYSPAWREIFGRAERPSPAEMIRSMRKNRHREVFYESKDAFDGVKRRTTVVSVA